MATYHVTLDGQGYMIDLASYRKSVAPPFAQKTRQGDLGYADFTQLSVWAQESWRAGVGASDYDPKTPDRYDTGVSIDPSFGDLRVGPSLTSVFGGDPAIVDLRSLIVYANKLYMMQGDSSRNWESAEGTTWTMVYDSFETSQRSQGLYDNKLLVGSGADGTIHRFDGSTWAVWGDIAGVNNVTAISAWYRSSSSNLAYIGATKTAGGRASLYSATTVPAFTELFATDYDRIEAIAVWDNNLWFAGISDSVGHRGALYRYDGTTFTLVQLLPDNAVTAMAVYRNRLYAGSATGGRIWQATAQGLQEVFRIPDVAQIGGFSAYALDIMGMLVHNDRLYVATVDAQGLGVYMYDGVGWSTPATGGLGQEPRSIASFGGQLYLTNKNTAGARIYRVNANTAVTGATYLSSWFDADLPSLDKLLIRLAVRHAALATGESVSIDYGTDDSGVWTNLGVSSTVGATEKTLSFPVATKAKKVRLRLLISLTATGATPKVRATLLEYQALPEIKAEWVFDCLLEGTAEMPLVTLDQAAETKTGAQLADTLWASKAKKQTLSFTDLDGEIKTVLFHDLEERVSGQSQREGYSTRGRVTLAEA